MLPVLCLLVCCFRKIAPLLFCLVVLSQLKKSLSLIPPSLLLHFDFTVDFLRDIARTETNEFLSQCNNAAIVLGGFGGSLIQFLAFIFPEARWLLLAAAILFLVGGITGLAGAPTTVKKIAIWALGDLVVFCLLWCLASLFYFWRFWIPHLGKLFLWRGICCGE